MTDAELLAVVVEFSIGLGGFSAVAAAFIHQNRSMKAEDIFRVLNLLLMALGPAFVALFALGVLKASLPIGYANGFFLFFLVASVLQSVLGQRRLTQDERRVLIPALVAIMQAVFLINGLLQLLSCLGILDQAFLALYGGLVIVLAQAVVQFVRLIVARPGT